MYVQTDTVDVLININEIDNNALPHFLECSLRKENLKEQDQKQSSSFIKLDSAK